MALSQAHQTVLELWRRMSDGWGFASTAVAETFKRETLTDGQKQEIVETLHALIAQYRRLDFALESAGARSTARTRDISLLTAALLLDGKLAPSDAAAMVPGIAWDAVLHVDARIGAIDDPVRRFAVAFSLPDAWSAALIHEYKSQARELARALNVRAPCTLRANTLKTTRSDLIDALSGEGIVARVTRLSAAGVHVENPARLFSTHAFREGHFELQDEGSQLIAELVAPARGSRVLDACAGSGGKTLGLSALMGGTGTLWALDVSPAKLRELRRRARRAGAHNIRALLTKPEAWPAAMQSMSGKWQRVVVDAPCSGSGALRRNPEARWRNAEMAPAHLTELQAQLARRALELCAPGARMIYATCSLFKEENEAIVDKLEAAGGCQCIPIKEILSRTRAAEIASPCGRYLKLLPHIHGTDGFFAAVLRKK